ncbi:MAG: hypothetical protein KGJ13_05775 [Patescibacteria group bacterium]|nr:hypothetical protein [Patescibacteria group bacterium]
MSVLWQGPQRVNVNWTNPTPQTSVLWGAAGPAGPPGGALPVSIATTNTTMAANNGYYPNSASKIIFQFPVSPATGSICKIFGFGSGGWQLDLRSGETVAWDANTTSGPAGTVYSVNTYDGATFTFIGTVWHMDSTEAGFS